MTVAIPEAFLITYQCPVCGKVFLDYRFNTGSSKWFDPPKCDGLNCYNALSRKVFGPNLTPIVRCVEILKKI